MKKYQITSSAHAWIGSIPTSGFYLEIEVIAENRDDAATQLRSVLGYMVGRRDLEERFEEKELPTLGMM